MLLRRLLRRLLLLLYGLIDASVSPLLIDCRDHHLWWLYLMESCFMLLIQDTEQLIRGMTCDTQGLLLLRCRTI
ncbi:hypothetical protein CP966_20220 [Streptomyces galilaeus]|nr:hypothetical protein CP966_20220 [Streptomyces galilaeus]